MLNISMKVPEHCIYRSIQLMNTVRFKRVLLGKIKKLKVIEILFIIYYTDRFPTRYFYQQKKDRELYGLFWKTHFSQLFAATVQSVTFPLSNIPLMTPLVMTHVLCVLLYMWRGQFCDSPTILFDNIQLID